MATTKTPVEAQEKPEQPKPKIEDYVKVIFLNGQTALVRKELRKIYEKKVRVERVVL